MDILWELSGSETKDFHVISHIFDDISIFDLAWVRFLRKTGTSRDCTVWAVQVKKCIFSKIFTFCSGLH